MEYRFYDSCSVYLNCLFNPSHLQESGRLALASGGVRQEIRNNKLGKDL